MAKEISECPTLVMAHVMGKRWTVPVMEEIYFSGGRARFNAIKRTVGGITARNLSGTLNELCDREFLSRRKVRRGTDTEVEYRLTRKGVQLEKLMQGMKKLGICWYGTSKNCTATPCSQCAVYGKHAK